MENLLYMPLNLLQKWEKLYLKDVLQDIKSAGIELILENIPLIIKETSFQTRKKKYPDKCPYYQTNKSCHPEISELNCFLCACPNYISEKTEGGCKINSKKGKWHFHKNLPKGRIWDCSDCQINHSPQEVKGYLEKNLKKLKKLQDKI